MWGYLELMNQTAPLIEDFYIYVLDMLRMERENQMTIFASIHWQGFRNLILKDPTIKRVINEVQ